MFQEVLNNILEREENLKKIIFAGIAVMTFAVAATSSAFATVIVTVPGTSNPYLAGMPDGTTSTRGNIAGVIDRVPSESPVLVPKPVAGGTVFRFSATGATSFAPTGPFDGPDGDLDNSNFFFVNHFGGAENGISDIRAPANALLGVFLGSGQPDLNTAPATLNFETFGTDFLSLSPALQQLFFIGDGFTSSGDIQEFFAPTGATRLFLGTMDGFGWFNNSGTFVVTVPTPGTLSLFGAGLVALVLMRRRNKA